jgi:hypothetical protein
MSRVTKLSIGLGVLSLLLLLVLASQRKALMPDARGDAMAVETIVTVEQRVKISTRNLSFEKENRTLAAARNLGRLGAAAKDAIPTLEKFIANKANDIGPLSDQQMQAFQEALRDIRSALPPGEPIPTAPSSGSARRSSRQVLIA